MKLRTDFVTNSSSSSFILAHKGELNEKQKEAVLKYIESAFLGNQIEPPYEPLEDDLWRDDDKEKLRKAVKDGLSVYGGWVSMEEAEYGMIEIYQDIWNILEKYSDDNFVVVDGRLDY